MVSTMKEINRGKRQRRGWGPFPTWCCSQRRPAVGSNCTMRRSGEGWPGGKNRRKGLEAGIGPGGLRSACRVGGG